MKLEYEKLGAFRIQWRNCKQDTNAGREKNYNENFIGYI